MNPGPPPNPPQEPVNLPPKSRHGTHHAYQHHKCRCGECQEFRRAYQRANAALRTRLRVPEHVPHGTCSTYNYYGCRCEDCCAARASYDRERMELVRRTDEYRAREGKRK